MATTKSKKTSTTAPTRAAPMKTAPTKIAPTKAAPTKTAQLKVVASMKKATASQKENVPPPPPKRAPVPTPTQASAHAAKMAVVQAQLTDTPAVLLAKIQEQQAEIDAMKKVQVLNAQLKASKLIPMPSFKNCANLQNAMCLENDKVLYNSCRAACDSVLMCAGINIYTDWRRRYSVALGNAVVAAREIEPQLAKYEGDWATFEIMKTILKYKRAHKARVSRGYIAPSKLANALKKSTKGEAKDGPGKSVTSDGGEGEGDDIEVDNTEDDANKSDHASEGEGAVEDVFEDAVEDMVEDVFEDLFGLEDMSEDGDENEGGNGGNNGKTKATGGNGRKRKASNME